MNSLYRVLYLCALFCIRIGDITLTIIKSPFILAYVLTETFTPQAKILMLHMRKKAEHFKHTIHSYGKRITKSKSMVSEQKEIVTNRNSVKTSVMNIKKHWHIILTSIGIYAKKIKPLAKSIYTTAKNIIVDILRDIQWVFLTFLRGMRYVFFSSFFNRFWFFVLGFISAYIVFLGIQAYHIVANLPSPHNIGKTNYALSTHIRDRNEKLLYKIFREDRTPITLDKVPEYLRQATLAIEDKDFYKHQGISIYGGMLRAVRETIRTNKLQGGSTITQQLVKSALLTPERTIERKLKEIILAIWTEQIYTKDEILEMYFNQVSYGGSSYGAEQAARTYFGKSVSEVTLDEAAFLAGLPQAPTSYSPYVNPGVARARRNVVLERMYEQEYIDIEAKRDAQEKDLVVVSAGSTIRAPHFVFYVRSQLEDIYGRRILQEGGLDIKTTVDVEIQEKVEKILREEIEKIQYLNVSNGAVLVMRPQTGEILAMVGSVDYFASPSGAFNVTTALRQPGSSIKPLLYSLALERNYTAASLVNDSPVVYEIEGSDPYQPVNYDGVFRGIVPLRVALANSFNIPAVRIIHDIGVQEFIVHARKMGISTWNDTSRYGLSLSLGGGEVKMVDLAGAFGVFANGGYYVDPKYIIDIQNQRNESLEKPTHYPMRQVINEGTAYIISDILSDNNARMLAFGPTSALEIPGYTVAVKTGTTDDKKDNWTVGYTPEFLVATWVGNNDNSPMNQYLASGITGAAPIWNRVMTMLLTEYGDDPQQWFTKPDNVIIRNCHYDKPEIFLRGTENKVDCNALRYQPKPKPTKEKEE